MASPPTPESDFLGVAAWVMICSRTEFDLQRFRKLAPPQITRCQSLNTVINRLLGSHKIDALKRQPLLDSSPFVGRSAPSCTQKDHALGICRNQSGSEHDI